MSDEDKAAMRIRYEYQEDSEGRIQYAHGVLGGINSQGEVEMNFYIESDKLPTFSERLLAADGSIGHESVPYDENLKVITRRIHSRVVLNYHSARGLMEWLDTQISALEAEGEEALYFGGDNGDIQH